MWGEFKKVVPLDHRTYVRAYWRYLLGWGRAPARSLDPIVLKSLRRLAREEVDAYKLEASKGGKIFYPFPQNTNDPPDAA